MIYFVSDPSAGYVKIGYSKKPWGRFASLQCSTAGSLEMLAVMDGDLETEAELHRRFSDLRVRGEWFVPTGELEQLILSLPKAAKPKRKSAGFWNGKTSAELSAEIGVSQGQLSRIISGECRPTVDLALKIQKATGVSAIDLVFGDRRSEAF